MELQPWIVAAGLALILAVLALKLRGPRDRGDLTGPHKPKPRLLSREEMNRLTDLVRRGEEEEALRQLQSAGYDETASRRLVALTAKLVSS